MTAEIIYSGQLRTKARHTRSGDELITDAPVDNQGKGEAFSPTDLIAASLGTCILTIMGIKARNEGFDIDGTRLEITKTMASKPRRIEKLGVVILPEKTGLTDEQKEMLIYAAHNTPVGRSLHPDLEVSIEFKWK